MLEWFIKKMNEKLKIFDSHNRQHRKLVFMFLYYCHRTDSNIHTVQKIKADLCHCKYCVLSNMSVRNIINSGCIPLRCASARALLPFTLLHWHTENEMAPSVMLLVTPVLFLLWQVKMSAVRMVHFPSLMLYWLTTGHQYPSLINQSLVIREDKICPLHN